MYLEQLKYLITVAEMGSTHVAADKLFVSQQNISKSIRQLESELGIIIFHRSNSGTTLTDDGMQIYLHAKKALLEIEMITNYSKKKVSNISGSISLYASCKISFYIEEFFDLYTLYSPNIFINYSELENKVLLSQLEKKQHDLCFFLTPVTTLEKKINPLSPDYSCFLLDISPIDVVVYENNPIAQKNRLSLNDLENLPLVFNKDEPDVLPETILDEAKKNNINLNIVGHANSVFLLSKYYMNNMAASFTVRATWNTPNSLKIRKRFSLIAMPLEPEISVAICLLVRRTNLSNNAQSFLDIVKSRKQDTMQMLF